MYDKISIGNRLFQARKIKNLKQSDVCKVLGINQSSYSDIETGKRGITVEELYILADFLSVPVTWLLGETIIDDYTDIECLEIEKFKRYIRIIRDFK